MGAATFPTPFREPLAGLAEMLRRVGKGGRIVEHFSGNVVCVLSMALTVSCCAAI